MKFDCFVSFFLCEVNFCLDVKELKSLSLSYTDCAMKKGGKTGEMRAMKPRLLDTRDTAAGTGLGESQGELTSDGLFWGNPSTKIL